LTESIQVRLARLDFDQHRRRDAAGQPLLAPDTVAEQGGRVVIADIRAADELTGALGFIPGSVHVPVEQLMSLRALGPGARVVLASSRGVRAAVAARLLELSGMEHVAAVEGGVEAWRDLGLPTTRDTRRLTATLPADPDAALHSHDDPDRNALSLDEVAAHVADHDRIRWVKLASFLLHGRTACVDGRDSQGVVGTPGGDVGEILLALGAADALGQPLAPHHLRALIEGWIEAFGRIYLHSDVHAMNDHVLALRADPAVSADALPAVDAPPTAWRAFHAAPPEGVRERVLHHLLAHMGCGHLRLLLTHSEDYGVSASLARAAIREIFHARWSGAPEIEFVILGGHHHEQGVLLVETTYDLHPYTRVPLVPPAFHGVQLFVHHPQVTAYQRAEVAHWLSTHPDLPRLHGREAEVRATIHALAERQMATTLRHLAPGLPIFRAVYALDRSVEVTELGRVPRA
jgi:rhodanese-related sulfurtransferase